MCSLTAGLWGNLSSIIHQSDQKLGLIMLWEEILISSWTLYKANGWQTCPIRWEQPKLLQSGESIICSFVQLSSLSYTTQGWKRETPALEELTSQVFSHLPFSCYPKHFRLVSRTHVIQEVDKYDLSSFWFIYSLSFKYRTKMENSYSSLLWLIPHEKNSLIYSNFVKWTGTYRMPTVCAELCKQLWGIRRNLLGLSPHVLLSLLPIPLPCGSLTFLSPLHLFCFEWITE